MNYEPKIGEKINNGGSAVPTAVVTPALIPSKSFLSEAPSRGRRGFCLRRLPVGTSEP